MDRKTAQSESDADYCAALARSDDHDRFLAAQFASPPARARLLALLAVNAEIARAPGAVREPLLAEMRLKWWHEGVMTVLAGNPPPRQPALAAFARAMRDSNLTADRLAGPLERLGSKLINFSDVTIRSRSVFGKGAGIVRQNLFWLSDEQWKRIEP
ncbi:MAG: squalene/phytoene synthase family protein, partial [Rhodospirillales bacterium]|nr:squalene/phytoene synthase family protein [Rhodospirillales bacterium]